MEERNDREDPIAGPDGGVPRLALVNVRDERSTNPLPWIAVGVCAAATFVLGIVPFTPSNVLPLVK